MNISTPVLQEVSPFDATEDFVFTFLYSGNQINKNKLTIIDNDTLTTVYDTTLSSVYTYKHTLPADTLVNGKSYQAYIEVGMNDDWSSPSEEILFFTYELPNFSFPQIDEFDKIYTQDIQLYAEVVPSSEGGDTDDMDDIDSYRYLLYDSNQSLIYTYPERLYAEFTPPLSEFLSNLENGITYYIELKTLSVHGQEGSSGLIELTAEYLQPGLSATLEATNNPENGSILINAGVVQVLLELYNSAGNVMSPETITYENNSWLDMNDVSYQKLVADDGIDLDNTNFHLQIWLKDIPTDEVLLKMFGSNTNKYIEVRFDGSCFTAIKHSNETTLRALYISNEITYEETTDTVVLSIKQVNQRITMYAEIYTEGV